MSEVHTASVGLDELRRYLIKRGWHYTEHPNSRIELFETRPDQSGDYFSVALPASENFRNAPALINETVKLVASYENTSIERLLEHVTRWDRDILRARLFTIRGGENSIPLFLAAEAISLIKDFMGYAAYTQSDPKPFFDKAGPVSAAFTKHCRFGHTFHGSFGLTVECPVTVIPVLPMEGIEPIVPFERQVFERIASGLSTLRRSIATESVDPMIEGYPAGFSANMCRTLAGIYEQADGRRIEYDFSWSPELRSQCELGWNPFIFEGRAYEFIKAAASELEQVEKIPDSAIEGRIVALRSETPPSLDEQREFEHIITMFWERLKDQAVRIRVPLSPDEYIRACDAHKEGRRIKIQGTPQKVGKFWTLTKTHDFTVLIS